MNPYIISEEEYVHKGFFDLKIDILTKADGDSQAYTYLLTKADAVSVLAQTTDGKYIVTQEYRHPVRATILGCPGGRIENEETPLDAAKRELLEETGYWAKSYTFLGEYFPLAGVCDQKIFLFFATEAEEKEKVQLEPFEHINVELYSEDQLIQSIRSSKKMDGILATIMLYKQYCS